MGSAYVVCQTGRKIAGQGNGNDSRGLRNDVTFDPFDIF